MWTYSRHNPVHNFSAKRGVKITAISPFSPAGHSADCPGLRGAPETRVARGEEVPGARAGRGVPSGRDEGEAGPTETSAAAGAAVGPAILRSESEMKCSKIRLKINYWPFQCTCC